MGVFRPVLGWGRAGEVPGSPHFVTNRRERQATCNVMYATASIASPVARGRVELFTKWGFSPPFSCFRGWRLLREGVARRPRMAGGMGTDGGGTAEAISGARTRVRTGPHGPTDAAAKQQPRTHSPDGSPALGRCPRLPDGRVASVACQIRPLPPPQENSTANLTSIAPRSRAIATACSAHHSRPRMQCRKR